MLSVGSQRVKELHYIHCTSTPTTITIGSKLSSLWYTSLKFLNDRNLGPVIIRVVQDTSCYFVKLVLLPGVSFHRPRTTNIFAPRSPSPPILSQ